MDKNLNQKKVALFGGTFNPVHNGHIFICKQIMSQFGIDEIIFIPTGDPPHKRNIKVASKEDRYTMLKLALSNYDNFKISRIEIDRDGLTYTVDTLNELKKVYSDHYEFYYIIGADTLIDLISWKNYRSVFKLTKFIVVGRPEIEDSTVDNYIDYYTNKFNGSIFKTNTVGPHISSTDIRTRIMRGLSVKYLIPDNVEQYIKDHGLYI